MNPPRNNCLCSSRRPRHGSCRDQEEDAPQNPQSNIRTGRSMTTHHAPLPPSRLTAGRRPAQLVALAFAVGASAATAPAQGRPTGGWRRRAGRRPTSQPHRTERQRVQGAQGPFAAADRKPSGRDIEGSGGLALGGSHCTEARGEPAGGGDRHRRPERRADHRARHRALGQRGTELRPNASAGTQQHGRPRWWIRGVGAGQQQLDLANPVGFLP
jgi:hypothetical protein